MPMAVYCRCTVRSTFIVAKQFPFPLNTCGNFFSIRQISVTLAWATKRTAATNIVCCSRFCWCCCRFLTIGHQSIKRFFNSFSRIGETNDLADNVRKLFQRSFGHSPFQFTKVFEITFRNIFAYFNWHFFSNDLQIIFQSA